MITFGYFYTYFLPLILHLSVSLCAEEPIQNATVSTKDDQSAVKEVLVTPNTTSIPSILNAPPEFPEEEINGRKVLPISANTTLSGFNSNITNVENITISSESEAKLNTTSTNDKLNTPSNATLPMANTSVPLDVAKMNRTDNFTSSNLISDVPPEFPQTDINGKKVLTFNTSLVTANLNTTEVKSNLDTTEIKVTNSSNKIDTEVPDLLETHINKPCNVNHVSGLPPNIVQNDTQNINRETEWKEDGQDTEDVLRNSSQNENSHGPGVPLVEGQLAAILAAVFVVISVVTYIGLLSWRRFLENRYGNRELLVNEDEFNDRDDLRHFSI